MSDQQAQMTPEQALQILDQASSQAPLNRQAHIAVQSAIQILAPLVRAAMQPITPLPNDGGPFDLPPDLPQDPPKAPTKRGRRSSSKTQEVAE